MNPVLGKALLELGTYALKELIDAGVDALRESEDNDMDHEKAQVVKDKVRAVNVIKETGDSIEETAKQTAKSIEIVGNAIKGALNDSGDVGKGTDI